MTDQTKGQNKAPRPAAGAAQSGETKVMGRISKGPETPAALRHAATLAKRGSATAPPMMKSKATAGSYFGENRKVLSRFESTVASELLDGIGGPNPLLRAYPESVTKGKHIAGINPANDRLAEARKAQASASFSTALAQFGISPEFDNYDALDVMAQHLIQLLQGNVYAFANLTKYERNLLFRYFHKYNPVIARIVELHTDLPLSKAQLTAPEGVPEIVRDYIMQFFERIFERLDVNSIMRDMVVQYYVYGEVHVQVDDSFSREADRILQDISHLEEKVYKHSDEDLASLQEVEKRYQSEPKSVGLKERFRYIETKFANFFDQDYQGPDKLSVLEFYNIVEYMENRDIDFVALRYTVSDSYRRLMEMGHSREEVAELGYSEGYLDLQELTQGGDSYTIDNDIYSGLPFLFTFRRSSDGQSIITRILSEALEWDAAQRAIKAKIENLGKLGRIVTAENASEAQIAQLDTEVRLMLEDPNKAIVANYKIEWDEVNSFIKEELTELVDRLEKLKVSIAMGAGIPDSLLSGDAAYSGDNIKLDLLNTYYLSFNQRLQTIIEEKLLKPIAMRKGFVSIDEWGYPTLLYPKMSFSRLGLRDSNILETLITLYQKGSLPLNVILDVLNLDPEQVRRGVEADMFTSKDPNFNRVLEEVYLQAAGDIYQETNVKEKIEAALKVKKRPDGLMSTTPEMQDAEDTPAHRIPGWHSSDPASGGNHGGRHKDESAPAVPDVSGLNPDGPGILGG